MSNTYEVEINLIRKYLKQQILEFNYTKNLEDQFQHLKDMLQRTAEHGESNSALLIGPRGSGKTTLINRILEELRNEDYFSSNTLLVHLNGIVHTNDRLALKATTVQLQLENAVEGKVFGSFSDNLAFLLACLKAGDRGSKSVIFILEEFDLFCAHNNQTLLYNLFDVAQSAQAPICVLGVTCRLDVIELLEKRVKSRFSHRQIFIFPGDGVKDIVYERIKLVKELLSIDIKEYDKTVSNKSMQVIHNRTQSKYDFNEQHLAKWNKQIENLMENNNVQKYFKTLFELDLSGKMLQNILFKLISKVSEKHCSVTVSDIQDVYNCFYNDGKVLIVTGLSVLELCLLIAMKHHHEIYDGENFNFEMIFARYKKFSISNTSLQSVQREVVLKAYEHLKSLELIANVSQSGGRVQKEYQLCSLLITKQQVLMGVNKYYNLPTEVLQWAKSSLI